MYIYINGNMTTILKHDYKICGFEESSSGFPVIKKKIGGTTYVVTGHQSPAARETAVEKMKRLILNDPGLKPGFAP